MKSYVVALDGSKDALNACHSAWQLARNKRARVLAVSIVDTQSIWDFLGHKLSGMIGSGVYISAFEAINKSLHDIAETLLVAFETRSMGYEIETETRLDEGNLADAVLRNIDGQDLLIMGRRAKYSRSSHTILRTSLSAKVAAAAKIPVLMVSSEPHRWRTARFILDSNSFDNHQVKGFFDFAEALNLQTEIFCLDTESEEFAETIGGSDNFPDVLTPDSVYGDDAWQTAVDVTSATVLVVPTSVKSGEKCVGDGRKINEFLDSLPLLSLMILPAKKTGI